MAARPKEWGHGYVFTIVGRCGRCQRTPQEHVQMLAEPDPLTECAVDHGALETKLLIGDGGFVWSHCPFCHVMVEAKLRSNEHSLGPTGPRYGPGRGELTPRMKQQLLGRAGWADFNGGR